MHSCSLPSSSGLSSYLYMNMFSFIFASFPLISGILPLAADASQVCHMYWIQVSVLSCGLLGVDLERHINLEARVSLEECSYQVYITWWLPVLTAVPALGWRFLHCTLMIALSATRFSLFPFYIFCSKMVFTFWSWVLLINVSWWCFCSACV
jgi:hypothetical protein